VNGAVAAIDCGTNSTRLLVVDGSGAVLAREMHITRLGESVDAGRHLLAEATERTLSVLRRYRRIMNEAGVSQARVVATSAVRDAVNGGEFVREVARITGCHPEVLSGDEEGLLSFRGATARLPRDQELRGSVLVVDIGGGSTELVIGPALGEEPPLPNPPRFVHTRSLDIGCVRVSERFLKHDPPQADELATARLYVREQIVIARDDLPALSPDSVLVGLAGTVSTVAALIGGITTYERDRIHHAVLDRDEVERLAQVLACEDIPTRLRRPAMFPGREDVIVGGILILAVVMEVFSRPHCIVSEEDILDGLVETLLRAPLDAGRRDQLA
jgi:exopolyphosphatase/guanosine-5'-triphosphate,3'-diphosphate pyrophosphatase